MTDACPKCGGPLTILGVHHEAFTAICDWCEQRAVWNESTLQWDADWAAWKLWALAGFFGILLWIVGHVEVMQ